MGNCIRKESSTQWCGEDWGSITSNDKITRKHEISHDQNSIDADLVEDKRILVGERVSSTGIELKIKISKKQLEQLLKKADVQGISIEQVLAQLTDAGDQRPEAHQRPWKPALQTIPE